MTKTKTVLPLPPTVPASEPTFDRPIPNPGAFEQHMPQPESDDARERALALANNPHPNHPDTLAHFTHTMEEARRAESDFEDADVETTEAFARYGDQQFDPVPDLSEPLEADGLTCADRAPAQSFGNPHRRDWDAC